MPQIGGSAARRRRRVARVEAALARHQARQAEQRVDVRRRRRRRARRSRRTAPTSASISSGRPASASCSIDVLKLPSWRVTVHALLAATARSGSRSGRRPRAASAIARSMNACDLRVVEDPIGRRAGQRGDRIRRHVAPQLVPDVARGCRRSARRVKPAVCERGADLAWCAPTRRRAARRRSGGCRSRAGRRPVPGSSSSGGRRSRAPARTAARRRWRRPDRRWRAARRGRSMPRRPDRRAGTTTAPRSSPAARACARPSSGASVGATSIKRRAFQAPSPRRSCGPSVARIALAAIGALPLRRRRSRTCRPSLAHRGQRRAAGQRRTPHSPRAPAAPRSGHRPHRVRRRQSSWSM